MSQFVSMVSNRSRLAVQTEIEERDPRNSPGDRVSARFAYNFFVTL